MNECAFCRIVRGGDRQLLYDDGEFAAFLDIRPRGPGHTLVVPRTHERWVWDVGNIGGYFEAVGKVANALRKAFGTERVVMVVMGDEVPHAHVHLLPRLAGDPRGTTVDLGYWAEIPQAEQEKIAERIRRALV